MRAELTSEDGIRIARPHTHTRTIDSFGTCQLLKMAKNVPEWVQRTNELKVTSDPYIPPPSRQPFSGVLCLSVCLWCCPPLSTLPILSSWNATFRRFSYRNSPARPKDRQIVVIVRPSSTPQNDNDDPTHQKSAPTQKEREVFSARDFLLFAPRRISLPLSNENLSI